MSGEDLVRAHFAELAEIARHTPAACEGDVVRAAEIVVAAFKAGGKLLLCGNGGSAADCQHVAAELVCRLTADFERPALPAIALTTDSSVLTAHGNDYGFDGVFARQVQALGRRGDVLFAISTSGASRNVIDAAACAKSIDMRVIALTAGHGELASLADVAIRVPATATSHIQEAHLAIEHVLVHLVERRFYAAY